MLDAFKVIEELNKINITTYHWFGIPVKYFSDKHSSDSESQNIICVSNTVPPRLFSTFRTNQSFSQSIVGISKGFREAGS